MEKKDLKLIIRYFMCCVILHNLLVCVKAAEIDDDQLQVPVEGDVVEDINVDAQDVDELDIAVVHDRDGGERRRQIFAFMLEDHGGF